MSSIAQFVIVLLCVSIWPSSGQCKSRTLTVDEFLGIADTELLGSDFCDTLSEEECQAKASDSWKTLNDEEWIRGKKDYEEKGLWYPYLFCHVGPDMTGHARKEALGKSLNASIAEVTDAPAATFTNIQLSIDKLKMEKKLNVAVLSNTEDYFCGLVRLPEPFACNMKDEDGEDNVIMQPLHLYMKVGAGTIGAVAGALQDIDSIDADPVFAFSLCPGATEEIGISVTQDVRDITDGYVAWIIEESEKDICNNVFQNRITAGIAGGDPDLSNDPDTLYVMFNTEDVTQLDVLCSVELIKEMANLPAICFAEYERESEVENDVAASVVQSGIINNRPFFDAGITGKGQIVAVSDTGLDINNCYFDQSTAPSSRQNNDRNKVVQYISNADSRDDNNGHGTHVCGTIAGKNGNNDNRNGVAKDAKIAFMDIGITGEPFLQIPSDTDLLDTGRAGQVYEDLAHIHSASWGTSVTDDNRATANGYTTRARNFDNYMLKNDDFLILVAAGNDGQYNVANSVGTPATAKNILSVGALSDAESMDRIASFSSRGPTQDGRRKPDILAPGQAISSAAGNTACGLTQKAGTSMATPATSGAAALVRQYFEEGWWPAGRKGSGQPIKPSGALVKAVLMNGAQWVRAINNPSQFDRNVEEYDENQGFGRVSLVDSLYIAGKSNVLMDGGVDVIADGQEKRYSAIITREGGCEYPDFRVTLVWTDEGAVPSCKNCLVNDLDLLVTKRGTFEDEEYYPNGLNGKDSVNNAERVIVENVEDGDAFEISIKGANLANDQQRFALVMTGCIDIPANADGFSFQPPDSGTKEMKSTSIFMVASIVTAAFFALIL